ncbi:MAG TPA: flagellar biosynthesis protein FlhF [Ignavibacteriales bacterium]|nr:flagellar biosynthesis protein FlhF [Ignavibacteriales bacterium]HOL80327.1 flagellar biosynthesis protein FlhF [Ignavibacteriales bacterium]HPP32516.1 flagellar biosynthesis protein FlhF [Ignavibacteriales bacterium]
MVIKKYIAPTLKEATDKMKLELGEDAVVLSTRIIDSDDPHNMVKLFEITAAIEENDKNSINNTNNRTVKAVQPFPFDKTTNSKPTEFIKVSDKLYQPVNNTNYTEPPIEQPKPSNKFEEELQKLRELALENEPKPSYLSQKSKPTSSIDRTISDDSEEEFKPYTRPKPKQKVTEKKDYSPIQQKYDIPKPKPVVNDVNFEIKEIKEILLARDVNERIVDTIIDILSKYENLLTKQNIDSYVISTISSMITTSAFEYSKTGQPKVVAVVGPTGVGKTTCIAKLAVIAKLVHDLNIGLISLDTYRLGAIDQLRIFSQISNIDMQVAYEPKDLPEILYKMRNKDIIFIDTAGRAQNNLNSLREIKAFFSRINIDEIYLTLSASGNTKYLYDVAEKFKLLEYNAFIFTKLDEAVSFGNILNLNYSFNIPIKYVTNGQVIPDDIISVSPEFLANLIFTNKLSKV